jgi:hypothetical protein
MDNCLSGAMDYYNLNTNNLSESNFCCKPPGLSNWKISPCLQAKIYKVQKINSN